MSTRIAHAALGLAALALAAAAAAGPAPRLAVEGAHVRAAPPGAPVLAGYMTLRNPGPRPIAVTGASSPDFERVEIHRTVVRGGVARMEPVPRLEIAPGDAARLEPGGMHLMLIGPRRKLRPGDRVRLTLHLGDGTEQPVELPVRRMGGGAMHRHGGHAPEAHGG